MAHFLINGISSMMSMPTGSGKSVCLTTAAACVIKMDPKSNVYVISPTNYLKQQIFNGYAHPQLNCLAYRDHTQPINYLTQSELMRAIPKLPSGNKYILIDEVDQGFEGNPVVIDHDYQDKIKAKQIGDTEPYHRIFKSKFEQMKNIGTIASVTASLTEKTKLLIKTGSHNYANVEINIGT